MASKSGGTMPVKTYCEDAGVAISVLGELHHWACTRNNDKEGVRGYSVTITHAGKRVTASRRAWIDAVNAALSKLATTTTTGTKLKLIR